MNTRPHIVALIQARMGSTRLPGKTLVDIAGEPFLAHVIKRTRASRTVRDIVVATTTDPADDAIVALAARLGAGTYRGSANDVLDRFYQAARQASAGIIVRITADDPFKDPDVIDLIVGRLLADPALDYASNTIEPTFPEGLDVEAFTFAALSRAWHEAKLPSEREHVTPYLWKNPDRFRVENVRHATDLSKLRWTLDYAEDLRFTREVYARLYRGQVFRMAEILALLQSEPQLAAINTGILRNAGYNLSLQQDQATP
jgi:spore coat polysaccharide biosynthesis protein SpsF